ncbi:MAG: putative toxin-antitoxin system toxin component, PIN family [Nitrospirae bacterium GWC2_42_7]|nr:MAG: putative toxin-antitoxin system toxin component, PIN family [Nitrospirae bacterium GWC2_42_7]
MRIVLDTNVLISGIITPFGNAARILDMLVVGELHALYDDRMLAEYREVLHRPKFGFEKDVIEEFLTYIESEGSKVTAIPLNKEMIDKDDIPFVETAITGLADVLITGNKRHFTGKATRQIKIMTPDEFLKFWGEKKK